MASQAQRTEEAAPVVAYEDLAREVENVALYINELRAAINGLGVLDMTDSKINAVQADINEVILTTRSATDTVLETAESLISTKQTGAAYRELVEARMIELMEACSFQDLTGQRLTRVAETLNAMEQRLKLFADLVKPQGKHGVVGLEEKRRDEWKKTNLLNGPSDVGAMDQDMVDWLMANSA